MGGAAVLSGATAESPVLGAVVIVFGVLGLVLGVWFFTGASWGWMLGVIVYVLSVPLGMVEALSGGQEMIGGAVRAVVGLVIIYYLTRPHLRAFFRK